jgi:hypothetical protein
MYAVAQYWALAELEYLFWRKNMHVKSLPSRDSLWSKVKGEEFVFRRVARVEVWRLEKQPGYKEKQMPEVLKAFQTFWDGAVSKLGMNRES